MIEEVKAHLPQFDIDDRPDRPRDLHIVVESIQLLKFEGVSLPEIAKDASQAVGVRKALVDPYLSRRQISLYLEKMRVEIWRWYQELLL